MEQQACYQYFSASCSKPPDDPSSVIDNDMEAFEDFNGFCSSGLTCYDYSDMEALKDLQNLKDLPDVLKDFPELSTLQQEPFGLETLPCCKEDIHDFAMEKKHVSESSGLFSAVVVHPQAENHALRSNVNARLTKERVDKYWDKFQSKASHRVVVDEKKFLKMVILEEVFAYMCKENIVSLKYDELHGNSVFGISSLCVKKREKWDDLMQEAAVKISSRSVNAAQPLCCIYEIMKFCGLIVHHCGKRPHATSPSEKKSLKQDNWRFDQACFVKNKHRAAKNERNPEFRLQCQQPS